jgi:exportin-2 (importin alpha re-exporter)
LGETISIIADSDFWTRWDTLIDVNRPYTCDNVETNTDAL